MTKKANNHSWGDYSIQIDLPEKLSDNILSWAHDTISDDYIYSSSHDHSFGREYDLHITILNGIKSSGTKKIRSLTCNEKGFKCQLGHLALFTNNPSFDVLIIDVDGKKDLNRLHTLFASNIESVQRYECYIPHVTIAYLKKGKGKKYLTSNTSFKDEKFKVKDLSFLSKNGKKTILELGE